MKFETMPDKEIESRFSQLIASTDATCGAPSHWFAVQSVDEKREILANIYRPGLIRLHAPKVPFSGGYTPYPPKENIAENQFGDDLLSMC